MLYTLLIYSLYTHCIPLFAGPAQAEGHYHIQLEDRRYLPSDEDTPQLQISDSVHTTEIQWIENVSDKHHTKFDFFDP